MTDISPESTTLPARLGTTNRVDADGLVFRLTPVEATCVAGMLRASVLSFAIDAAAGIAVDADPDRWSFTSDMVVRSRPMPAPEWLEARAQVLRNGRRSATSVVRVVDQDGIDVAYGAAGFSRVDRRDTDPPKIPFDPVRMERRWATVPPIDVPLHDAMGLVVLDPATGVVEVEVIPFLCNPAGTLQGAMVAALAEAAAEQVLGARWGVPAFVTELDIRYLAQNRTGPIRTSTEVIGDGRDTIVVVELHDMTTGTLTTHVLVRAVPFP
jgi:acyl-coenzyme A thioesterase PaaI-like protein